MTVRVRFFAGLRERVGRTDLVWSVEPGTSVQELWEGLCKAFPVLNDSGGRVAFAVNREYVDRFHTLDDNDEVAMIPPVSGG